jgi:hypothetical protein
MLRVPCISLSNKRKKITVMIQKKENSLLTDKARIQQM